VCRHSSLSGCGGLAQVIFFLVQQKKRFGCVEKPHTAVKTCVFLSISRFWWPRSACAWGSRFQQEIGPFGWRRYRQLKKRTDARCPPQYNIHTRNPPGPGRQLHQKNKNRSRKNARQNKKNNNQKRVFCDGVRKKPNEDSGKGNNLFSPLTPARDDDFFFGLHKKNIRRNTHSNERTTTYE